MDSRLNEIHKLMLEQAEILKKKVAKAGTTSEAVKILLDEPSYGAVRIVLKSLQSEIVTAYKEAAALKQFQEEEENFYNKWEEKTMQAFKKADTYNARAKAIRQIIPAFRKLDGKILSVKIEQVLKQYNTENTKYEYVKYDLHIEIRAVSIKHNESFCVLGIYKPQSDYLDQKKLQAEPIIKYLTDTAKRYDQTAQEARKIALSLHDEIRNINRHFQVIQKIRKKLQNNHIINEITYDFFRRMNY